MSTFYTTPAVRSATECEAGFLPLGLRPTAPNAGVPPGAGPRSRIQRSSPQPGTFTWFPVCTAWAGGRPRRRNTASICWAMKAWCSGRHGWRRYSFSNIFMWLSPFLPGLLADIFVDALPEFAVERRLVQSFGFATQLDAVHHVGHNRYRSSAPDSSSRPAACVLPEAAGGKPRHGTRSKPSARMPSLPCPLDARPRPSLTARLISHLNLHQQFADCADELDRSHG